MNTRVIREVIALEHKTIDEPRAIYERLFSKQPESNAGSPKLISDIAYSLLFFIILISAVLILMTAQKMSRGFK